MTPAKLAPRLFLIEQTQNGYPYWIRLLDIYDKPMWYILLNANDVQAYLPELKDGYETAELALEAWQKYADEKWPRKS